MFSLLCSRKKVSHKVRKAEGVFLNERLGGGSAFDFMVSWEAHCQSSGYSNMSSDLLSQD